MEERSSGAAAGAVVLLSGGLDSAVALGLWLRNGGGVAMCLTAAYGQRSASQERATAQRLAHRFGVPWRSLELPFLGEMAGRAGSALVPGPQSLPRGRRDQPGDQDSANAVWVPARNGVFVAVAAAEAEACGADVIVLGLNRDEAATFPDNSEDFLGRSTAFLALATRHGVRVESPTVRMDKQELGRMARALGLGPSDVWSCYDGGDVPCGACESCLRLARAFDR